MAPAQTRRLPLSIAQRGMWVSHQIAAPGTVFSLAEAMEMHGELNVPLFVQCLHQLANELDCARTRILESEEGPVQEIAPVYSGQIPLMDLSTEAHPRDAAWAWMQRDLASPLQLDRDELWKVALLQLGPQHFVWYHRCHHIVIDGFAGGLVARRMAEIYSAAVRQEPVPESTLKPFEVVLDHERDYRGSRRQSSDQAYWTERLAGLPEPVSLSGRRGRTAVQGGLLRSSIALSVAETQSLRGRACELGVSMPQLMVGLVAALVARLTGRDDFVLGMPVTARMSPVLRKVPGMMANAVALRFQTAPDESLQGFLQQAGKTLSSALRHQQYRYESLRRDLGLMRADQQISWMAVNIEPFDYDLRFGELSATAHNLSNGTVEDLAVFVYDRGEQSGLVIDFDANPGLYRLDELERHAERLRMIVEAVLQDPAQPLRALPRMTRTEKASLEAWNLTARAVPHTSWLELFLQQAEATPYAEAVFAHDGAMTYSQLEAWSFALAQWLVGQGLSPGSRVGMLLARARHLVVAGLAIQRAGLVLLPLDPEAPPARIQMILEEGQPGLVLCDAASLDALPSMDGLRSHRLDDWLAEAADANTQEASLHPLDAYPQARHLTDATALPRCQPTDPAYVMFTSGSTGRPKGVVVPHGALCNFLLAMEELLGPTTRLLAVTTVAFDISHLELDLPLITGGCVVLADRDTVRDPAALARLAVQQSVTHLQATPSLWQLLVETQSAHLRGVTVLVGGELLSSSLARSLASLESPIFNLYGPTETTIWSTAAVLSQEQLGTGQQPSAGRPLWNTQLSIVDSHGELLPPGLPGELWIGGMGVALGYLGRDDLTADRFLANPFGDGRVYRTGDLACWTPEGEIQILGRLDHQIKVRGHRIEPAEIESILLREPGVRQAAVLLMPVAGRSQLVAYVVSEGPVQDDPMSLRRAAAAALPDYMVPAFVVALEAFPLTPNGKLDRAGLPIPSLTIVDAQREPTPTEEALLGLFHEVLGHQQVGLDDSLFELGGDSLVAARLMAALRSRFGVDLPLSAVFDRPTIAGLAERIDALEEEDLFAPVVALRPLQHDGGLDQKTPLFCLPPVLGLGWSYSSLLGHLPEDQALYALQIRPTLDLEAGVEIDLPAVAERLLMEIRTVQPAGPYRLVGWSFGGLLAHEIARQLEEFGDEVELLGLIDSYPWQPQGKRHDLDESREVELSLRFLGIELPDGVPLPQSRQELVSTICEALGVFEIPLVQALIADQPELPPAFEQTIGRHLRMAQEHLPGAVSAPVLFFRATEGKSEELDCLIDARPEAWRTRVGSLQVWDLPCGHQQVLDEVGREKIARVLSAACKALDDLSSAAATPSAAGQAA